MSIIMKATRPYVMTARAEAVAQTRERILQAITGLAGRGPLAAISLADVAADANVSVQTVLRQFGSRDGLIDAAVETAHQRIVNERTAPSGDVPAAVSALVDSYEKGGDGSILLLGQEPTTHALRASRRWGGSSTARGSRTSSHTSSAMPPGLNEKR